MTEKVTRHGWTACHVLLTGVFMVLQCLIFTVGGEESKTVHHLNGQVYQSVAFFPRWT